MSAIASLDADRLRPPYPEVLCNYYQAGRFDDASKALNRLGDDAKRAPYALINDLIAKEVSAPVRYKL